MAAGVVSLSLIAPVLPGSITMFAMPNRHDAILLVLLAVGCTLVPFALSLVALRQLSAFTTALALNMEPVYAILMAIVLLGEQRQLMPVFYVGVAIVIAVVFSHGLLERRKNGTGTQKEQDTQKI
jgi:drug/metabolite transporter (DMT)-like permease